MLKWGLCWRTEIPKPNPIRSTFLGLILTCLMLSCCNNKSMSVKHFLFLPKNKRQCLVSVCVEWTDRREGVAQIITKNYSYSRWECSNDLWVSVILVLQSSISVFFIKWHERPTSREAQVIWFYTLRMLLVRFEIQSSPVIKFNPKVANHLTHIKDLTSHVITYYTTTRSFPSHSWKQKH